MVRVADFMLCVFLTHTHTHTHNSVACPSLPSCLGSQCLLCFMHTFLTSLLVEIPLIFPSQMAPPSLMTLLTWCPSIFHKSMWSLIRLRFRSTLYVPFGRFPSLKLPLGCKFLPYSSLHYSFNKYLLSSYCVPAWNIMPAFCKSSIYVKLNWNVIGGLNPKSPEKFQSDVTLRRSHFPPYLKALLASILGSSGLW